MPRRNESLVETLIELPPWVALAVAAFLYLVMRFILPSQLHSSLFVHLGGLIASLANWAALFFLFIAGVSAILHYRRKALLEGQTDIESIRQLPWRKLEILVAEAYKREGYSIMGNSGPGSDGGVDILARKDGETVLVQCKQWKARKVGVKTVREMFGLLNSEGANEVHVVTSGAFTQEARDFAANKPITLIDGLTLLQMVKKAQTVVHPVDIASDLPAVLCPNCGSAMSVKTAKRGKYAGQGFWGCQRFPACNGVRKL